MSSAEALRASVQVSQPCMRVAAEVHSYPHNIHCTLKAFFSLAIDHCRVVVVIDDLATAVGAPALERECPSWPKIQGA